MDDVDEANARHREIAFTKLSDIFYDACAKLEKENLIDRLPPEAQEWWKKKDKAGADALESFKKTEQLYGSADQKLVAKHLKRKLG